MLPGMSSGKSLTRKAFASNEVSEKKPSASPDKVPSKAQRQPLPLRFEARLPCQPDL
jgi:hypothetical protein